jgi:hypothetical protein
MIASRSIVLSSSSELDPEDFVTSGFHFGLISVSGELKFFNGLTDEAGASSSSEDESEEVVFLGSTISGLLKIATSGLTLTTITSGKGSVSDWDELVSML